MGKKSKPKTPDFEGIAEKQAQANKEATLYQTQANRPTQVTPWGTSQWEIDPETGMSRQDITLDPMDQQALDYQQRVGRDLSGTAATLTDRVRGDLASPVDYGG